jgi:CMP-N-acetylneuraminic acid synthetase
VYVVKRNTLLEQGSFYGERFVGLEIPPERSVNIDTPEDWQAAERLLSNTGGDSL